MRKKTTVSRRFWTVLGAINALVLVYPIWLFLTDGNDAWFAAILMICAAFLLVITDMASVLVVLSLSEY